MTDPTSHYPRVSILVSVYNGADHVRLAVESLLEQTFRDFELIVIDDASSDATVDILNEISRRDPRIRVVRQTRNTGLTRALNHAAALARGTVFARQDADDIAEPERLERQMHFLDTHPDVGIVGTAYHEIDGQGHLTGVVRPPVEHTAIRAQAVFHSPFCHTSVVFRRAVIDGMPFLYDEKLRYSQDMDLWWRLLVRTRGANLSEPLVRFRGHSDRISTAHHDEQQAIANDICSRALSDLLPNRSISKSDVTSLRRFYYKLPEKPTRRHLALCQIFFDVLNALAAQPDTDSACIADLRCNRVRLLLNQLHLRSLPELIASGLLRRMLTDGWRAFPAHAVAWLGSSAGHRRET